ncbi:hypothetical protein B0H12DRAFT_707197 [Mycena haematopus]|nr:hypothetical protein B0H12DRAFT_707197 [Mycena haematopus]
MCWRIQSDLAAGTLNNRLNLKSRPRRARSHNDSSHCTVWRLTPDLTEIPCTSLGLAARGLLQTRWLTFSIHRALEAAERHHSSSRSFSRNGWKPLPRSKPRCLTQESPTTQETGAPPSNSCSNTVSVPSRWSNHSAPTAWSIHVNLPLASPNNMRRHTALLS